jgi:hypothetical protein
MMGLSVKGMEQNPPCPKQIVMEGNKAGLIPFTFFV